MVLGFALAICRCRKTCINKEHIYNLALWLIPVCIICARAYYVIFEWDNYKNDLISVFEINRWGFAILWLTHFGYKRIKKTAPSPIIMILFSAALGMLLWGV